MTSITAVGTVAEMCWSVNARDGKAARVVRKQVTAALGAHTADADVLSAAELVVGELLSNAARHAHGHICLELTHAGGHAQVTVHDTSPTFVLDISRPTETYAESGRGLFIISELARRVAVFPVSGMGKRVCVTLDLPVTDLASFSPACSRTWLRHDEGVCMAPRVARYLLEATPSSS